MGGAGAPPGCLIPGKSRAVQGAPRRSVPQGESGQLTATRSPSDPSGREHTPPKARLAARPTMADHRRLLRPAALDRAPGGMNRRPRYKETLPSECFIKHKHRLTLPTTLNSRRWIFVRKGLDDFRKGCLPCEGLITQGPQEGLLPKIYHRAPRPAPKKRRNKLPKEAALLSKLSPAQGARKAFLADVEAQLTPHPLALYPNLGEDLPVELLLKVLEVLDPDRKLEDAWAYCQGIRKRVKEPTKLLKKRSTQVYVGPPRKMPVSYAGQWHYEEKKPNEADLLHEDGPVLHENVRRGVSDFCNWATTFGSLNIDEEFVLRQFDVDYQSKPSYDELHAMRLNRVPLELKKSVGLDKLQEAHIFQKLGYEQKLQKPQNPYKPKRVKMRYGAWYLNTKLWKKQRADEPLVDPKVSHKGQDENFKKELQEQHSLTSAARSLPRIQTCKPQAANVEQEELLADLPGTVAFKDFILSRGYKMPSFLEKIYIKKKCKCECNKTSIK
ncbi:protein FAM47E isoform X1 [Equus asinus]|uniref:protein FAM47E isoform X1 n=1 Tax=Equus asinus TaxID=9793 RepID=UPI0038F7ECDF